MSYDFNDFNDFNDDNEFESNNTPITTPTMPTAIFVSGPSGVGKSSIAKLLQQRLNVRYNLPLGFEIPFIEGFDFHPEKVLLINIFILAF